MFIEQAIILVLSVNFFKKLMVFCHTVFKIISNFLIFIISKIFSVIALYHWIFTDLCIVAATVVAKQLPEYSEEIACENWTKESLRSNNVKPSTIKSKKVLY